MAELAGERIVGIEEKRDNPKSEPGRLGFSMLQGYWIDAGTLESLATANMLVRESPPVY